MNGCGMKRTLLIVSALLLLTACGFRLRGSLPGLEDAKVFVEAPATEESLLLTIQESIDQTEMTLVDSADAAEVLLRIDNARLTRRTQTVGEFGRAQDYELILTVTFKLGALNQLSDQQPRSVDARREYNFDNTDLLGKAEEEALLVREMQREIAARLLRQVSYQASELKRADAR